MNAQRPFQRVFPLMRHRLPFSLAVAIIVLVSSGATEAAPTTGAREQVHPNWFKIQQGAVPSISRPSGSAFRGHPRLHG